MSNTLTIAQAQLDPNPADLVGSVARLEQYAAKAKAGGASLLVIPEMSMTGYEITLETLARLAQPANGALADQVSEICQKHSIAIAYGFGEQSENQYFNSVQLIDETGVRLGLYRKTHLWGGLDRSLFSPGESLNDPIEFHGWKIGFLICYDIEFPEAVRTLCLKGAELLLVPTGLMKPWRDVAERVVPVRALENHIFIAYTNYCGHETTLHYEGRSCIVDPHGIDLARAAQGPELLIATLDRSAMAEARTILPYHTDRRPALYQL